MIDWSVAWKGTKLIDRIEWAKQNLKRHDTEYCVVYEDLDNECASIMHPDPHCMAMLMHGNLMPPAWVKLKLKEDCQRPDFVDHRSLGNDKLLHETQPIGALTEEEAIEYLITTDVPRSIWESWNEGNRPKMVICRKSQLPATREWRNAWRIADEIGEMA
jgi:hypothetical protein